MNQDTVRLVHQRANGACERCGATSSLRWSLHHRRPRGMGGTKRADVHSVSNVLMLCGSGTEGCHGWVESNRAQSYEVGLLLRSNDDPAEVPVLLRRGLVYLNDEGGVQPC